MTQHPMACFQGIEPACLPGREQTGQRLPGMRFGPRIRQPQGMRASPAQRTAARGLALRYKEQGNLQAIRQ